MSVSGACGETCEAPFLFVGVDAQEESMEKGVDEIALGFGCGIRVELEWRRCVLISLQVLVL